MRTKRKHSGLKAEIETEIRILIRRLDAAETRLSPFGGSIDLVSGRLRDARACMHARRDDIDPRFDTVDMRFDHVEGRLDGCEESARWVEGRLGSIEGKADALARVRGARMRAQTPSRL